MVAEEGARDERARCERHKIERRKDAPLGVRTDALPKLPAPVERFRPPAKAHEGLIDPALVLKPVDRAVAVLRDPVRVDRAFFNVILVQAENSPYLRKGEECAGSVVARGNAFELSDKRGELPRRRHRSELSRPRGG